jgi:hypothetical protein
MDPNELVTVYTCSNSIEANILRNALADEEIECFLQGENQAAEAGLMGFPIQLQVPAEQAETARAFLAEHDRMRAERKDADDDDALEEHIAPVDA